MGARNRSGSFELARKPVQVRDPAPRRQFDLDGDLVVRAALAPNPPRDGRGVPADLRRELDLGQVVVMQVITKKVGFCHGA